MTVGAARPPHPIAIATLPKCAPLAMWANAALASAKLSADHYKHAKMKISDLASLPTNRSRCRATYGARHAGIAARPHPLPPTCSCSLTNPQLADRLRRSCWLSKSSGSRTTRSPLSMSRIMREYDLSRLIFSPIRGSIKYRHIQATVLRNMDRVTGPSDADLVMHKQVQETFRTNS
jgi:hypothetical protein